MPHIQERRKHHVYITAYKTDCVTYTTLARVKVGEGLRRAIEHGTEFHADRFVRSAQKAQRKGVQVLWNTH